MVSLVRASAARLYPGVVGGFGKQKCLGKALSLGKSMALWAPTRQLPHARDVVQQRHYAASRGARSQVASEMKPRNIAEELRVCAVDVVRWLETLALGYCVYMHYRCNAPAQNPIGGSSRTNTQARREA